MTARLFVCPASLPFLFGAESSALSAEIDSAPTVLGGSAREQPMSGYSSWKWKAFSQNNLDENDPSHPPVAFLQLPLVRGVRP
jgi:hypothetical protein